MDVALDDNESYEDYDQFIPAIEKYSSSLGVQSYSQQSPPQPHSVNDEPAIVALDDGTEVIFTWCDNGVVSRPNDKPAVIEHNLASGQTVYKWLINGKLTRYDDKPAVVSIAGTKRGNAVLLRQYYLDNLLHRVNDKPAHITKTRKEWRQFGYLHRENDKPAVIDTKQPVRKEWHTFGMLNRPKDKPSIIVEGVCEAYYFMNKLHRDEKLGPAYITLNESMYFCQGLNHCTTGPAHVVKDSGVSMYKLFGCLHRNPTEGPAIVYSSKNNQQNNEYYMHGLKCTPKLLETLGVVAK